jgi:heme iron utilization protein
VTSRQHGGSGAASSDVPEPSLAERARTLAAIARIGSLSTHSRRFSGFPFGSLMPFAADGLGKPVFFISSMAMHTQNLREDERASLLIAQPDATDDPLGSARVTLIGPTRPAPAAEVRDLYLSHYENARYWQDYSDFAYYRLDVEAVYFIGGFGVMGWVPADEYRAAAPDPLVTVASLIILHMNADHADILRGIATRETGENPDEVRMTAVDRLGFHLRLKTGDRFRGLRVAFPREVRDVNEAREVFIEMA